MCGSQALTPGCTNPNHKIFLILALLWIWNTFEFPQQDASLARSRPKSTISASMEDINADLYATPELQIRREQAK